MELLWLALKLYFGRVSGLADNKPMCVRMARTTFRRGLHVEKLMINSPHKTRYFGFMHVYNYSRKIFNSTMIFKKNLHDPYPSKRLY